MTVSRPVKILVLVLVLAGVAGIASMSMLGKSSGAADSAGQLSVEQIRARAHKAAGVVPATPVKSRPAKASHTVTTTPARQAPKPVVPAAPKPTTAANGLPIVLADALRQHRVVVVSLFDPQSQTDAVSYAEARAGAADAGAGFIGVSVLDDIVAGPLTAALPGGGLLPVPGLLIYRGPGTLIQRVDGFADRDSVAQLAVSARTAPAFVPPPAPVVPVVAPPVVTPPSDSSETP